MAIGSQSVKLAETYWYVDVCVHHFSSMFQLITPWFTITFLLEYCLLIQIHCIIDIFSLTGALVSSTSLQIAQDFPVSYLLNLASISL